MKTLGSTVLQPETACPTHIKDKLSCNKDNNGKADFYYALHMHYNIREIKSHQVKILPLRAKSI